MRIDVVTPFPEMIAAVTGSSIARIAVEKQLVDIRSHDLRPFAENRHYKVDDYPFGGGDGMIMLPQPFFSAMDTLLEEDAGIKPRVIFPTPDGRPFTQELAQELSGEDRIILLCGHYKGIDQRVRDTIVTDEISIGDYVLTGGELAALVIIDATIRLIPGVIGTLESATSDSFSHPLLDCPWYTRPENFRGLTVPDVLLSGHHANIDAWRHEERLRKTKERRPDLYQKYVDIHPPKRSKKK